jgi:hypothetical protein
MASKKIAADDFDWSLESYDDPDYGEIKEWTYDTGKDEFMIQSYVDEDGIEHFDATSSVNGLLNDTFDGFDSFKEAENACYNAADRDDEKEADDPFATEASAKKAEWSTVDYSDYPGMEDVTDAQTMTDEANDDDYTLLQYSDGHVELEVNGNNEASYSSMDEAKQDVYDIILDTGYLTVKDPESILDSKVYDNGDTAKILCAEDSDEIELFVINAEGDIVFRDNGNKSELDQLKNECDEREGNTMTAANKKASIKTAHDVSNLDAAISVLSDQLELDPDNELADMLADLVEYRNSEAEETVEDEIEAHGENVPITEQDKPEETAERGVTASVKKADLEGWKEDEPGTFYKEFSNDFEVFVGDATGNGFGYTILNNTDNDLPSNELYSKDGFDSIEEAKAAADAWWEENEHYFA